MKSIRYILILLPFLCLMAFAAPSGAGVYVQCPLTAGVDATYDPVTDALISNDGATVCIHLVATDGFINMADKATVVGGRPLYTFGFKNVTGIAGNGTDAILNATEAGAEFPAPTISVKQGQDVYLTLTNRSFKIRPDLFDAHTVHWHGFPNAAAIFDGEPMSSLGINPGSSFTYFYRTPDPGTYMYHCHQEASEHMQMGMLGQLFVRPVQDGTSFEYPLGSGKTYTQFAYNDGDGSTGYDVVVPLQITSMDPAFHDADQFIQPLPFANMTDVYAMINGRGYPDTVNPAQLPNTYNGNLSQKINSIITATAGQKILLRISSLSTVEFDTLISPSIPMTVVGKDTRLLRTTWGQNIYYNTNTVTLGGGMAVDVILDTTGIAPGTYFIYTSNLSHLSNDKEDYGGMMTEITIN